MQKLKDNHGYPKVSRALRYSSIRLRSRPETAALGQEIEAERARLDRAQEAFEQAREERVAATALISHLDSLVDEGVAAIAREVAVITGNNTDDEFYKRLFPVAPSSATAPVANDSQNRFVRALIDRIESDNHYESLRPSAETLKASQSELDRSIQEREDLRTQELTTSVDRKTALDSGRRAYNKLYPKLTLIFESKGFVETFFVSQGRPAKAALDEEGADMNDALP